MNQCRFEKSIVDFIDENLSPEDVLQVQTHLKTCKACQLKYREWQTMQSMLLQRQRPNVPEALLNAYQQNLKNEFTPGSRLTDTKDNIIQFWKSYVSIQPFRIRILKTLAILLIGICIGRFVFNPVIKHDRSSITPNILLLPVSGTDLKLMSDFFTESEIWLLGIVNIDGKQKIEISDLVFNKIIAQKLLMKTSFFEEKVFQLHDESIIRFFHCLEYLLLEISNSSDQEINEAFSDAKQTIEDTKLLYETKRLQEMFASPKNQEI